NTRATRATTRCSTSSAAPARTRRPAGRPLPSGQSSLRDQLKTLTQAELQGFLAHAAITAAGPERGIGRELCSRQPARRTVVIHFGADDPADYITRVVSILLSMEDSWVLVGRYGSAAQLGALTTTIEAEALVFDSSE